jgi:hypothetical protein
MHDAIQDLTSAHWWITVAIASLVLNILAAYFVRGLDRFLPRLSARLGSWTGRKAAEFTQDIDRASKDIQLMTFLAAQQAGLHVAAIHNYVIGALLFYAGVKLTSPAFLSTALWFIGFLFTLAGSSDFGRAMRCKLILDQVQRKTKESNKSLQPTAAALSASDEPGNPKTSAPPTSPSSGCG